MSRAVVEGPPETVEMERAEPPDAVEKGRRVEQARRTARKSKRAAQERRNGSGSVEGASSR